MELYFEYGWTGINLLPYIYFDFDEESIEDDNKFEISIGWLAWEITIGIKK